jgi:hypothetical protein
LNRTWTTSSFSDNDYHTRWWWYTTDTYGYTSPNAQKSVRILVIPSTVGWGSVTASIQKGYSGQAKLSIPSAFQSYLTGSGTDSGDTLNSYEQIKDERFFWRVSQSETGHNTAYGFTTGSAVLTSPTHNGLITLSPTLSSNAGVHWVHLYHYDYNGQTGTADHLIDSISFNVTNPAALDTNITLSSTAVNILSSASSYSLSMTQGGSNTLYYILDTPNLANGSNIAAASSNYIARTWNSNSGNNSRPFETVQGSGVISNGLPTSGSATFYLYAADGNAQNSIRLTTGDTQYTVTPQAQAPSLSPYKTIINGGFQMWSNPSGATSGTIQYQWKVYGGGSGSYGNTVHTFPWTAEINNLGENAAVGGEHWKGTSWTVQARATVDNGATYDYSSTSSSITLPDYSFTTVPNSIQEGQTGTFTVASTNGLGPIYWEVTTAGGGDFSTSSGQVGSGTGWSSGSFSVTPSTDNDSDASETATIKLYITNTLNSANDLGISDTFTITGPSTTPTADTISGVTWSSTNTANSYPTVSWSGGSGGTSGNPAVIGSTTNSLPSSSSAAWVTDLNQTSPTTLTQDANGNAYVRGTTYYFWARRSASVVSSSFSSTAPYIPFTDTTITINAPTQADGTALSLLNGVYEIPSTYGSTASDYIDIPFSDGETYGQYRALNDTPSTPQWVSSATPGSSGNLRLIPTEQWDLPTAGNTYDYSFSGTRPLVHGGNGIWQTVNSGATISIKRLGTGTPYTVSANSTSVDEGETIIWTVTYSNIPSSRTVGYTISGINSNDISSGSLSGTLTIGSGNGTVTTSIRLLNDVATEGTETATLQLNTPDSAGTSTGRPSAGVTILDTSTQGGSSGGSDSIGTGPVEDYGLEIYNAAGTQVIINNNSRIGTFIGTQSITLSDSNTVGGLFTHSGTGGAINCSDNTIIGLSTTWTGSAWLHPTVTRNTSTGLTVRRLNSTSTGNTFWDGTLFVSLIRY